MSNVYLQVAIPLLVAFMASVGTYFVSRRTTSGRIDTSDANALWKEAGSLRDAYKQEAEEARAQNVRLQAEIVRLREETIKLKEEALRMKLESRLKDL